MSAEGRLAEYTSRVRSLVDAGADEPMAAGEFERLALRILRWQREQCAPIDRAMKALGVPDSPTCLVAVRGLPTDAFKTAEITCTRPLPIVREFWTSGTTHDVRGRHGFANLDLYRAAALESARRWLLPARRYGFVLFAEAETASPTSSLSYMLARFVERWEPDAADDPWVLRQGAIEAHALARRLEHCVATRTPAALLGATAGLVRAIESSERAARAYELPPGSVIMPTGGFKGVGREFPMAGLFADLERVFGVSRSQVVQEYGMTELSSQAYERRSPEAGTSRYVPPPWMLVTAVDPVTLEPLPHGEEGILRVIDLANVGSCIAVQTLDRGTTHSDGFEVHGRLAGSSPRGCARALDALLTRGR